MHGDYFTTNFGGENYKYYTNIQKIYVYASTPADRQMGA